MLRRLKKMFGFSTRGSYCPNPEDQPSNGSMVSTGSRKSNKKSKKDHKVSPLAAQEEVVVIKTTPVMSRPEPIKSGEIVIGGEETVTTSDAESSTTVTDSLPYRDPSDKSQDLTCSINTPVSAADGASTCSISGSEAEKRMQNASSVDSVYSSKSNKALQTMSQKETKTMEVAAELPVESGSQCDGSSMCVNTPNTIVDILEDVTPRTTSSSIAALRNPSNDDEMEAKYREMNEQLNSLLTKPAPFKVSTARLPGLKRDFEMDESTQEGFDYMFDENEEEMNNSVTRILNETHEKSIQSPEGKHLRSFGY